MKKGQRGEGIVQEVLFPNKGVVLTAEGERVIVKNTIPGQRVSFGVNKARKGKYEGRLLEVLEKSKEETAIPCSHFGQCGGCTYQSLPYEKQLAIKENQVRSLIKTAVGNACAYEFQGIKPSPRQSAYRNKMEFSFGDEYRDGPLALGMHRRESFYDLVTVRDCQIVDGDFRSILNATLDFFSERRVPYYHRLRHEGYLRHLLVRKAVKTEEILVDLVTTTQGIEVCKIVADEGETKLLAEWADCLRSLPLEGRLRGILHTKNDSVADVVKNEGTDILWGEDYFYEELLGLRFRISPFSFFQTNSLGAEVLYRTVREYILGGDENALREKTVYDLYSGTGTIAQMMAPVCREVVGVEIVEEAVAAAWENARENGLSNCRFIAGDVLKILDTIETRPDYIILDPPRDGVHPKALERIISYGVERLVYISCKPTSLARDLEVFLARGYHVEKVCCVDLFPGTYHVETIVLLSHKLPDSHINVKIEFGEGKGKVSLNAIAERAKKYQPRPKITYKMIQEYVERNYGFKVHTAYIAEVKRSLGLTMYDAPNAVEELKPSRKHPPKEKVEAIKDALKHFEVF